MNRKQKLVSVTAEEALIGSLLGFRKDAFPLLDAEIKQHDFFSPELGAAWICIGHLHSSGLGISTASVVGASLQVASVTLDPEYLERVVSKVTEPPTDGDLLGYVNVIRDLSSRRRLRDALDRAMASVYVEGEKPEVIVDEVQRRIMEASNGASASNCPRDIREVAADVYKSAQRMAETGGYPGVTTGFKALDSAILGFCPGELVVVGARPGMGKSALLGAFAQAVAGTDSHGAVIFSLEMPDKQFGGRMLSSDTGIGYRHMRTGQLTSEQWSRLALAVDSVPRRSLSIADRVFTLSEIRQHSRRTQAYFARHGKKLSLIGVDYLQLIWGTRESRQESVSDISRGLKIMATELDCTVVALSQLNRALESRENRRPMLSDLRESGAIEQDANAVLFLHRENYYNPTAPEDDATVIVAKNRNGPLDDISIRWIPSLMRYEDLT